LAELRAGQTYELNMLTNTDKGGEDMRKLLAIAAVAAGWLTLSPARADIAVGFVTSLSGNASSLGIPYGRGIAAANAYRSEINGQKIRFIQLDDGSDPSAATRAARKLVEEEKVDILIGTATVPSTIAMVAVANELKVPLLGVSPISVQSNASGEQWAVTVTQPAPLMLKIVSDRMKRDGSKNIGYIGYSDAWGDLVYNGAKAAEAEGVIKVITNERYTRSDTSVTAQALKLLATRPDGVLIGGSGTQGALPLLTLVERGFKGKAYGVGSLVNADFIRVGGKSVEGVQVTSGPVIVAEQLPDDHYAKKISLAFRDHYQKANGVASTDSFSAYSFDAWLIFNAAAELALQKAKPGTPEFRRALADGIFDVRELKGTQGVYNFKRGESYGVDERSLVILQLRNGAWTYAP
jgi:branched-chain amino acid transport system substrate-binding protein